MSRQADDLAQAISLEELQDIVDRLEEDLGNTPSVPASSEPVDNCAEADAVLAQAHALRVLLRRMGPKAPACFTDRIVAAALEIDPVPDPAAIHRLPE